MSEIIWGVSCLSHDAALAVIQDDKILYASHGERYSRIKNSIFIEPEQVQEALEYGVPDRVVYFERPRWKNLRRALSGEAKFEDPVPYLKSTLGNYPIEFVGHHESHAAGGFYTSTFDSAAVVVVDAIGELDTVSIWHAKDGKLTRKWSQKYPNSMGLFYSAMTARCGLKPNEDEYIMMGMAGYGRPIHYYDMIRDFFRVNPSMGELKMKNLHQGVGDWKPGIDVYNIAASAQAVLEDYLTGLMIKARNITGETNLVYSGGVALNCSANTKVLQKGIFEQFWIMPNPGDAGSALGAALAYSGRRMKWESPYLGTDIDSQVDPKDVVDHLIGHGICGLAHGRAEYGPRAFGNRSLLADPETLAMKHRVNRIKRRQEFRPFAPIVPAKDAIMQFEFDDQQHVRYMQMAVPCRIAHDIPAVVHVDGTSRVQALPEGENPFMEEVLRLWSESAKYPILLNTSLNIKGEPLVNTRGDALRFSNRYDIKVF